jgi:hypothetical protein
MPLIFRRSQQAISAVRCWSVSLMLISELMKSAPCADVVITMYLEFVRLRRGASMIYSSKYLNRPSSLSEGLWDFMSSVIAHAAFLRTHGEVYESHRPTLKGQSRMKVISLLTLTGLEACIFDEFHVL